ncbi:hypothetical protein C5E45_10260 [Nocardia nova]|uniref:Uncharacterized protein n=1 Tax=Nocardia nova TaxID=37330 RepID=A0A2S6ASC1_9NOCA|nr:hypothetical protein C5E41_10270 [Nocardia nova]PPJ38145.1 hypothetical protein C5E45_10260 [Nocardia nova]
MIIIFRLAESISAVRRAGRPARRDTTAGAVRPPRGTENRPTPQHGGFGSGDHRGADPIAWHTRAAAYFSGDCGDETVTSSVGGGRCP